MPSSPRRPAGPSRLSRPPALVLAALLVAVGLLVSLAGCSDAGSATKGNVKSPSSAAPTTPTPTPTRPGVYVAVGASETVGVGADDPQRDAWPQVLHDTAIPASRLVNVGVSGATVRGALEAQLPAALAVEPDVATVWLAVNDLVSLVPVATYETELQRLVHALRRGGDTEVLVGNVPDLWQLPAYRACIPGSGEAGVLCLLPLVPTEREVRAVVADYNDAIQRVVEAEGAQLVDLSGRSELTGLTADDGFHPSSAGHRQVAEAFAEALAG